MTSEAEGPEKERPVAPEDAPVVPLLPKKTLKKKRDILSAAAPAASTSQGHVSAIVILFSSAMILTRVAPEPMLGCLQPSVGLMDV
jgi:hypothetical protein